MYSVHPYTTPFGKSLAYGCKVCFEDGRPPLDLQSPVELQDLDWNAIAQQMAEGEAEEAAAGTVKESLTVEPPEPDAELVAERDALKTLVVEMIERTPDLESRGLCKESLEKCRALATEAGVKVGGVVIVEEKPVGGKK